MRWAIAKAKTLSLIRRAADMDTKMRSEMMAVNNEECNVDLAQHAHIKHTFEIVL